MDDSRYLTPLEAVDTDGAPGETVEGPIPQLPELGPDADRAVIEFCERHAIPRRTFLKLSAATAAVLMLPAVPFARRIAVAVATQPRLPLVWINGADCNGDVESLLRATNPTMASLVLDRLAINYSELLMAPSGAPAHDSLLKTVAAKGYVAIVEGAIPTGAGGTYCCVGGRSIADVVRQVAGGAIATIAVGTCATSGGLPAARGGVTGAVGLRSLLGAGPKIIALPGCPMNVENLTATIVQYLTTGSWPATDSLDRPLFAYGSSVHSRCPRHQFYEEDQFVRAWGDAGHQKGWCLRYMGCQGPRARSNCPTVKWNQATSFPIAAGAVCLSCTEAGFWDAPGGFYAHRDD